MINIHEKNEMLAKGVHFFCQQQNYDHPMCGLLMIIN